MNEHPNNQLQELLGRVGLKLRAAREAKGLTLQEISSRTRINQVFLHKIEMGETENLPGLAFVRGFIRNYLQVLELDDPDIDMDLKSISGLEQFIKEVSLGSKITDLHGNDEPSPLKKPVIIGLAVIFVIWGIFMIYRLISQPDEVQVIQKTEIEQPLETEPDGETGEMESGGEIQETGVITEFGEVGEIKKQPSETQPPKQPVRKSKPAITSSQLPLKPQNLLKLTIRGLEPTWIRVSIDRAPPLEVKMEPAETMAWEANEELRLTIGKSQGVAVYLNGEDILIPEEPDRLIPTIVLNKLTLLRLEN